VSKDCDHQWKKWSAPVEKTSYSPTLALYTNRLVQFRDCETCGESQARYVGIMLDGVAQ